MDTQTRVVNTYFTADCIKQLVRRFIGPPLKYVVEGDLCWDSQEGRTLSKYVVKYFP